MILASTSWMTDVLNTAIRFWGNCSKRIWELLTSTPEAFSESTWSVMETIGVGIQAIAYSLLVLFFGVSVVKNITNPNEMRRPETVFRLIFRFIIAKTLVTFSFTVITTISKIGIGLIGKISEGQQFSMMFRGRGAGIPDNIISHIDNVGFFASIPLSIIVIIAFLIIVVLSIVALMTVYARFFKMYIYAAIAPIPLAAIAGESTEQHGWQFIKAYVVIFLEGAVIGLACLIYTQLARDNPLEKMIPTTSDFTFVIAYLVGVIFNMLIMIGVIKSADQMVSKMTGI